MTQHLQPAAGKQGALSASTLETTERPLSENLFICPQSQIPNESRLPADDRLRPPQRCLL